MCDQRINEKQSKLVLFESVWSCLQDPLLYCISPRNRNVPPDRIAYHALLSHIVAVIATSVRGQLLTFVRPLDIFYTVVMSVAYVQFTYVGQVTVVQCTLVEPLVILHPTVQCKDQTISTIQYTHPILFNMSQKTQVVKSCIHKWQWD